MLLNYVYCSKDIIIILWQHNNTNKNFHRYIERIHSNKIKLLQSSHVLSSNLGAYVYACSKISVHYPLISQSRDCIQYQSSSKAAKALKKILSCWLAMASRRYRNEHKLTDFGPLKNQFTMSVGNGTRLSAWKESPGTRIGKRLTYWIKHHAYL